MSMDITAENQGGERYIRFEHRTEVAYAVDLGCGVRADMNQDDLLVGFFVAGLVGHPEPTPDPRRAKSEERWDIAVDWLINCNVCADPDIQTRFWALVDGDVTRDRVDQADLTRLRAKAAKRNGDTP